VRPVEVRSIPARPRWQDPVVGNEAVFQSKPKGEIIGGSGNPAQGENLGDGKVIYEIDVFKPASKNG
jgi:hypothetical protein